MSKGESMNFFQGEQATLYLTILDGAKPVNEGVSGTTVDVYHFDNAVLVNDVSAASMTQQSSPFENIWYYDYPVASGAMLTTYNVLYNAMFSGTPVQSSETFNVLPATQIGVISFYSGSVAVSGTVVDPSGVAIPNAGVAFISGSSIFASATTNASGDYLTSVNPGDWLLSFTAADYFTNQFVQTVPSGATYNFGLTTLVPQNAGTLSISDTLVTLDAYGNPIPLSNIKVVLWSVDSVGGGSPLGTTFTNVSGTFFLNADPGNYVLQMAGMDTSYNRYNQTRNIEVNAIYNFPPTGPFNFQYGDTSMYNYL